MEESNDTNTTLLTLQASNDQPGLHLDPITFLSCHSLQDSEAATPLTLSFHYELFTVEGVDVTTALEEFEGSLLNGVADSLGLLDCSDDGTRKKRGLRSEEEVWGVSSDPVDEVSDGE